MSTKTLTIFTFFSLYVVISSGVVPGQDSSPSNGNANAISRPPAMTFSSQTKQNVVPINRSGTSNADFLSTHNAVRLLIGHSPLTWNDAIAYFAEQWARKRVNDCELIHSGGLYGENLFWGGSPTDWSPTTVVKIWAAEKAFYDPNQTRVPRTTCAAIIHKLFGKIRLGSAVLALNGIIIKGLTLFATMIPRQVI
ncbi:hypothetical protein Goarm_020259 [Gossypium armourianum]|uniref:SCP domain-containing protein n=1 Tax=Gossypium armourianum TaxID=34283 RepID=A0A7J9INW3_9ROSI|nr:hypothetical protein [Gossypium armourianum]